MKARSTVRVGVLLPCRNEAAVIQRRLANLALLEWPRGAGPQRLIVVDDHSTDDTAALAREALRGAFGENVRAQVVANGVRPGKNGAIEQGLNLLGNDVDLIVLTDADVLVEPGGLLALCDAFAGDERLGMACGTQCFVRELDPGGCCDGAGKGTLLPASEVWDRWTAGVRRLESRFGRLFSVHGQWLAWRADLDLVPERGVAADDVDLMLQVRAGPRPRVRMVPAARFFECKPAPGAAAEAQGLRRARAWFQVFGDRKRPVGLRGFDSLQWSLYAHLPGLLPWLCLSLVLFSVVAVGSSLGPPMAVATLVLWTGVALSPFGREWLRTLWLIVRARRLERDEAMPEAWEMTRDS